MTSEHNSINLSGAQFPILESKFAVVNNGRCL